jgi:hypothetical protein
MNWPRRLSQKSSEALPEASIDFGLSKQGISRACRVLSLRRSSFYLESTKDDTLIEDALKRKAQEHPIEGS